mgnify:CR=1 FL=1
MLLSVFDCVLILCEPCLIFFRARNSQKFSIALIHDHEAHLLNNLFHLNINVQCTPLISNPSEISRTFFWKSSAYIMIIHNHRFFFNKSHRNWFSLKLSLALVFRHWIEQGLCNQHAQKSARLVHPWGPRSYSSSK